MSAYTVENLDPDNLRTRLEDATVIIEASLCYFDGFRFASPHDLDEGRNRFVIATDADGVVVGILKYDRFTNNTYERTHEGDPKSHLGVFWVDVREDHRQQGVSRLLVQGLRDTTVPPHAVELSELTKMGRRAKLLETFRRHFHVRRVGSS